MSANAWKVFEKSDGYRRVKLKLKQLVGQEPKLTKDIVLETEFRQGWQLVPALLKKDNIVYSFGVCDDIGFEVDVCHQGALVFAFDPTPYSVDWVSKQETPFSFKFFPWAAAGTDGHYYLYPRISKKGIKSKVMYSFYQQGDEENDGVKVRALSLPSIAKELGHTTIDVLKMDIEGAEYEFIDSLLTSNFRPRMLLIEFHHRFRGIGKERTLDTVHGLREAGYLLASISVTGREVCFVHKTAVGLD